MKVEPFLRQSSPCFGSTRSIAVRSLSARVHGISAFFSHGRSIAEWIIDRKCEAPKLLAQINLAIGNDTISKYGW